MNILRMESKPRMFLKSETAYHFQIHFDMFRRAFVGDPPQQL